VLYVLLVINRIGKPGHEQIIAVISLTVLLSIFLHGITAIPFSKSFEKNKLPGESVPREEKIIH
jgi:NhaP-type Na+/H+ or K+/H+ antiporter